mmetsp:Transcript_18147/g.28928  ORF Transcript_18147/g.28928 Transcript_18147/m.28928 type:complete len:210 (-) Transcript_18147:490-1119(-)
MRIPSSNLEKNERLCIQYLSSLCMSSAASFFSSSTTTATPSSFSSFSQSSSTVSRRLFALLSPASSLSSPWSSPFVLSSSSSSSFSSSSPPSSCMPSSSSPPALPSPLSCVAFSEGGFRAFSSALSLLGPVFVIPSGSIKASARQELRPSPIIDDENCKLITSSIRNFAYGYTPIVVFRFFVKIVSVSPLTPTNVPETDALSYRCAANG